MVRPISALRYSSTRYPGFGLDPSSGYQAPATPAAAPAPISAAGSGGSELIPGRGREGVDGRGDGGGSIQSTPATLSEAYKTGKFLDNPLAQVAAVALPFPLNVASPAIRAITTGFLASDQQRTFNAGKEGPQGGLSDAEAYGVSDPRFGLTEADLTSAGDGSGLTERAVGGNLGPVGVTSEAISGPSTQYSGPAQTAPSEVAGGEVAPARDAYAGPSGARDEIGTRDGGGVGGAGGEATGAESQGTGVSSTGGSDVAGEGSATGSGADADAAGGGGGDSKIICTELFRQKLMPLEERQWSYRGTMTLCSATALRGYHYWGIPVVRAIRHGKWLRFWTFVCRSRARELAYQIGLRSKPDYAGKFARLMVEPASFVVGTILNAFDRVPNFGALYTDQYPRI